MIKSLQPLGLAHLGGSMPQPRSELMRPGLPFWAAAFVGVACVALVGISVWHQWLARQSYLRSAEVEMANLARSLTQHADDTFDLADTIVSSLTTRLESTKKPSVTIENIKQLLQLPRDESRVRAIYIYDENGDRIATTTEKVDKMDVNNANRQYFQHHMASPSRETLIGHPVKSDASGLSGSSPSRAASIMRMAASPAWSRQASMSAYFANYYRQFDVGKNGAISLVSSDGIMLARSRDTDEVVGRDLSASPIFSQRNRAAGGVLYYRSSFDGHRTLVLLRAERPFSCRGGCNT